MRRIMPEKATLDPPSARLLTLDKKLQVRRSERTFVIDIHATSEDAIKAARIANAFCRNLHGRAGPGPRRHPPAGRRARSPPASTSCAKACARRGEVQAFKDRNNIVDVGGKLVGDEQLTQAASLQSQAKARVAEAKANTTRVASFVVSKRRGRLRAARRSHPTPSPRCGPSSARPSRRETELATTLAGQHPALIAAQSQVRDARRQIADEHTRISQAAKAEYDRAPRHRAGHQPRFETLKKETQTPAARPCACCANWSARSRPAAPVYQAFPAAGPRDGRAGERQPDQCPDHFRSHPAGVRSNVSRKLIVMAGILIGLAAALAAALARGILLAMHPQPASAAGPASRRCSGGRVSPRRSAGQGMQPSCRMRSPEANTPAPAAGAAPRARALPRRFGPSRPPADLAAALARR